MKKLNKFIDSDAARTIFHLAKMSRKRPSEIAGYFHPYLAYIFDIKIYNKYNDSNSATGPRVGPSIDELDECEDEEELLRKLGVL